MKKKILSRSDSTFNLIESLKNGTPYNSTGDLISRSALKNALETTQYNDIDDLTRTERIIDNAQTVESERPQGEWVGNAFNEHHCNRCGHPALWEEEPDDYYEVQSRFCPNCGADMRGKEE